MGTKPIISQMENPDVLSLASGYGSAFSRGTKVEIETPSTDKVVLYFLSGTASVDENGKSKHIGYLDRQANRMVTNIEGILKSAGSSSKEIVTRTTYVNQEKFGEAKQIVEGIRDYPQQGRVWWLPADICRKDLYIETDALAVKATKPLSGNLAKIVDKYESNLARVMIGQSKKRGSERIMIDDLCFLFIFDYAESPKGNDKVSCDDFRGSLMGMYERVTQHLEEEASWNDVVNTRFNLPQLLATPPDFEKEGQLYYHLLNECRNKLFKDKKVKPFPSSTCVGTKIVPADTLIAMSALAIYQCK